MPAFAQAPGERRARTRIRVTGLVQGVGFRPHVYRLAARYGLRGFVQNDAEGVLIEAEGAGLPDFLKALQVEAPPLARIDGLEARIVSSGAGLPGFRIRPTGGRGRGAAAIPPDAALCQACLEELFDPGNRRYLHPFIACSDCGPRATMTRALPFDRMQTVMADFSMCSACAAEYEDPSDRRFHAEPIACSDCGPRLDFDMDEVAARLREGRIVALKGLGGFHLAGDARNAYAVERLRQRKGRDGKPFAVMVLNAASAARLAEVPGPARALLESPARPVMILDVRAEGALAPGVSCGLLTLGLLLPSTPLHYLLFHALSGKPARQGWYDAPSDLALVMTSANRSGEPLVADDTEARDRLAGVADTIAGHDRPITARMDDSVLQLVAGEAQFVRRARGYAPIPLRLGRPQPAVLALGAHLKSTVTLTRDAEAIVSPHIGDLDTPAAIAHLRETADRLCGMAQVRPERIACDLHPDMASTRLAEELAGNWGLPLMRVQHHHAHIAAVAAEHGRETPLLGLALDGLGLGTDGRAWGGELLLMEGARFERLGHLAPLPLLGGDRAAREPWRMAAAVLHRLGRTDEIADRFPEEAHGAALAMLLRKGGWPETTALGRWFDAAAALLSLCSCAAFDAEAPMRLEALARDAAVLNGGWNIAEGVLDLLPLLAHLADVRDPVQGANIFHGTLAAALADWALGAARAAKIDTVALGGGCFLNRVLTVELQKRMEASGLSVLRPRQVPPNDGGISLGQAYVAGRAAV